MKKVLFFVSVFLMLSVAISCKNSNTNSDSSEEEKTEVTTKTSQEPEQPEQPIVNPVVDLSVEYYYLGDMLFADSMDFSKWFLTNGSGTIFYFNSTITEFKGIIFKVEKVGRVHNPNKDTTIRRYSKTLEGVEHSTGNWFYVEYATKYKVWVSKEFINPENKEYWINDTVLLDTTICKNDSGDNVYDNGVKVDGTWIKLTYSQNENLEDVYTFEYKDQDKAQYYN